MTDVILLGHGSADPRAAAQTQRLARQVDALLVSRGDSARIDCAYLDNHPDSLTAVLTRLETSCALIVPLFLANAFHVRSDIPAAIASLTSSDRLRACILSITRARLISTVRGLSDRL